MREAKSSEKKPQNSIPSGRGVEKKKKKNFNLKDFDRIDGQGGLLNTAGDMVKIRLDEMKVKTGPGVEWTYLNSSSQS